MKGEATHGWKGWYVAEVFSEVGKTKGMVQCGFLRVDGSVFGARLLGFLLKV
jgi:hypothetical protein